MVHVCEFLNLAKLCHEFCGVAYFTVLPYVYQPNFANDCCFLTFRTAGLFESGAVLPPPPQPPRRRTENTAEQGAREMIARDKINRLFFFFPSTLRRGGPKKKKNPSFVYWSLFLFPTPPPRPPTHSERTVRFSREQFYITTVKSRHKGVLCDAPLFSHQYSPLSAC